MRAHLIAAGLACLMLASAVPAGALPADEGEAAWLAGDWHVHTNASHDACAAHNAPGLVEDPEDGCGDGPHTLSADGATRMRQAEARGLDYLRITDHNTLGGPLHARANYEGPVTLVPGYEHSLPGGHAGITTADLLEEGVFPTPEDEQGIDALIEDVHDREAGLFVANHPYDGGPSVWTGNATGPAGWGALELWNIHWLWRDDLFGSFAGTSNNDRTLELWTQLLNEGHEIPVVGGSDNHWLATTAVQGPGQPTTWVKADANEPGELVEAVHEGRTYISWDPVGPRVTFTGSTPGGSPVIQGSTLPTGEQLTFEVEATAGAGERIRVVSCQGIETETPPGLPTAETTVSYDEDCWVRAEVLHVDDAAGQGPDDLVYRAITSPIYVR